MVPAPAIRHQELSLKIAALLYIALEGCTQCKALLPVDWQITPDTVVQPDVLVVCGENEDEKKLLIPPALVFEILSPATARKDRIVKYQLYENAGVKYYCIVDPENSSIEVFTLNKGGYDRADELEGGGMTFDLGPCRIHLDFNHFFK
jgi:Uma2 family endonuclease